MRITTIVNAENRIIRVLQEEDGEYLTIEKIVFRPDRGKEAEVVKIRLTYKELEEIAKLEPIEFDGNTMEE